jgi:spermidine synthase
VEVQVSVRDDSSQTLSLRWFFFFFFVSGFCSILYELIWLRLAMAQFGVTSALVSIVLSMFMAGLGLGSWGSGVLIRRYESRIGFSPLRLYALTELLIGASALLVPYELLWGRHLLESTNISASWAYYVASGVWVGFTLIPWCACMGATIPVAMLAIRRGIRQESRRSFSFLYLANVLGAVAGALLPMLLIEINGFHKTLATGALFNGMLALSAFALSLKPQSARAEETAATNGVGSSAPLTVGDARPLVLLFGTGLTSMGIEVVWIRQYTPYLGTVVYAFAGILALYLLFTYIGSLIYRFWSRRYSQEPAYVWGLVGLAALFSAVAANPQIPLYDLVRPLLGIPIFSAVLGFVTPMLVDRWSGGDPDRAGRAYAVNVIGCIIGPLLTGFVLLPLLSERWVLFLFSAPWLVWPLISGSSAPTPKGTSRESRIPAYGIVALALLAVFFGRSYEEKFAHRVVLRDDTATVIATGEGRLKKLLVNGYGITILTPTTKIMAHLPLASLTHPPRNALVICFGMGTTFRSLLSWNIPVTAVELVPSVPKVFWYYHNDAPQLLRSPNAHVVIDDGRRYLERTSEQYDVITIDPPPPVPAAGSSLLYSKEFYTIIRRRLRPGGIVQQWLPNGDPMIVSAVARALKESFPYVRVFNSFWGLGFHFLASEQPIPVRSADQLLQHMPPAAIADLMEWGPERTPDAELHDILGREFPLDTMIALDPHAPALQDDRPVNEYYLMRNHWDF